MAEWRSSQFRLEGGLNEEDPQFTQKPGAAANLLNYECLPGGGYRRLGGYERFSGHWWSSAEFLDGARRNYQKIAFTDGDAEPELHTSMESYPSLNVSGILIAIELVSGSWGLGSAAGYFVLTGFAGTAADTDDVMRSTDSHVEFASVSESEMVDSSIANTLHPQWVAAALDYWRPLIVQVGGDDDVDGICTGPVQGVFTFEGELYAWRSSVSDTTKIMLMKALGASGWTEIVPTSYLAFDAGDVEINVGDEIEGGTSGATATVAEVNIAGGNITGPTFAYGRLFLTDIVGTFQDNEDIEVSAAAVAVVDGVLVTPDPISGTQLARHKTVESNFYGADDRLAIYGCDGYNDPYIFDGTNLMFFTNGMATKPQYIEAHRNHLFLAYPGGSLQNSGTGQPLVWSVRQGAAEIGLGDDPTGMQSNGNNTLAITGQRGVHILTGTSDLDWNLRQIANESESIANTLAGIGGQTLFLDKAGVSWLLPAPPTYQDYTTQQVSRNVRKTIEARAPHALFALAVPDSSQYRLFFDDNTFLIASFFANKLVGWSRGEYAHQMTCGTTGYVLGSGVDTPLSSVFMGTDDGYIMSCDHGESFAGEDIAAMIQTPFHYHGFPDRDKRFHKITLEMETEASLDLRVHLDFDYGTGGQTGNFTTPTGSTGGLWDVALWDAFFWDSGILTAPETNIDGVGRNVAVTLYHNDNTAAAFTISAALLQFSPYGIKR